MSRSDKFNLWLLHGLHVVMALALPAALFLLISGCMKAHEQKEDLGPAISADTINKALDRIQAQATFNNLKVGQYLVFADTRRIENADSAMVMGAKRIDVIDRRDTTNQARFTFKISNSMRLVDGKFESTVAEFPLWLNKVAGAATSIAAMGLSAPASKISAETLAHSRDVSVDQPQTITFHHLQESDGIVPASDTMKARSDCAGLNPCQLPAHFLQFDMVLWNSNGTYQKISFDFAYSLKTPFLPIGGNFDQITGLMIADCRSTYIPVQDRTVYVRDCLTLDDFQN